MQPLNEIAKGRWTGVLQALEIPSELLDKRHHPCPICGGKDRWQYTDYEGVGSYVCRSCGNGDGVKLLMEYHGWSFGVVAQKVKEVVGQVEYKAPKPKYDAVKALNKFYKQTQPVARGDATYSYLKSRGLKICPTSLRTHARAWHNESKQNLPCMVGIIKDSEGKNVSMHRTFVGDVTPRKKMMTGKAKMAGCAIRLFKSTSKLAVTEGIETGIAVHEMYNLPVWASATAHGMETLKVPTSVEEVVIFADRDKSMTGQASAYILAKRLKNEGFKVSVNIPQIFGDWLDVLLLQRGAV